MRRERANDLAFFVVRIGIAPTDYWALTLVERNAIVTEFNKQARRRQH